MRRIVAISVFVSMVTARARGLSVLGGLRRQRRWRSRRILGRSSRRASSASWPGMGHDVAEQKAGANGTTVDLVLSPSQRDDLVKKGINPQLKKVKGKTLQQLAAEQAADGYTVWRSYDEPGGIRDQLYAIAASNPAARQAGQARPHRPGSRDPRGQADPGRPRPAGRQPSGGPLQRHPARARVDRDRGRPAADELLHRPVAGQRQGGQASCCRRTELWFIPVANPDGYQYTFDHERLWRKNLRDNNGDGQITGRRRRRPEPQLPQPLGLRRRGLVVHPVERHLPRPGADLGAGDRRR